MDVLYSSEMVPGGFAERVVVVDFATGTNPLFALPEDLEAKAVLEGFAADEELLPVVGGADRLAEGSTNGVAGAFEASLGNFSRSFRWAAF